MSNKLLFSIFDYSIQKPKKIKTHTHDDNFKITFSLLKCKYKI